MKFKVGDIVKVITKDTSVYPYTEGDILTVIDLGNCKFPITCSDEDKNREPIAFDEHELEHVYTNHQERLNYLYRS